MSLLFPYSVARDQRQSDPCEGVHRAGSDRETKEDVVAFDHSETELIRRIVQGERELFRELISRHKNMVYGMIMRQVSDHATAEDLAQEVFLKAYTNLNRFRGDSQFATWITRIALNATTSYFSSRRYKERRRSEPFEPIRHDHAEASASDAEDEVVTDAMKAQFRTALATLHPRYREVIVLIGLEGRSYEDAADTLEVPIGTVRSRLSKARELLRAYIEQGY